MDKEFFDARSVKQQIWWRKINRKSPDEKDKGEYTCILSNDMGFFSKSVKLGL